MEKVKIVIVSSQSDGETRNESRDTAAGIRQETDGCIHLAYRLPQEGTPLNSYITIRRESVEIRNSGAVTSCMLFHENQKTETDYRTPYGIIPLEIETKRLQICNDSSMGRLAVRITYTLSSQGRFLSENKVEITVLPL